MTAWICLISTLAPLSAQGPDAREPLNYVSLIRVIAIPKAYDDRKIRVAGYLDYNGIDRNVGIYVTEADGKNFIRSNSVDLEIGEATAEKARGQYVILEATYHAPKGSLSDYTNGYFDHVTRLKSWKRGDSSK